MDFIMKTRTIMAGVFMFLLLRGIAIAGYTDNGNNTVTDTVTNLMWQKQDDATIRTWELALTYCEGLSLGGHTDWRLPNVKELKSLADMTRYFPTPTINPVFTSTQSSLYWSSTTNVDIGNPNSAGAVSFVDGSVFYGLTKNSQIYVRCVR
jgi:hypothetical protein